MSFPKVLVLSEKHCDRYYHVTTEPELRKIAQAVLHDRIIEGWYFEGDLDEAKKALGGNDTAAWRFLLSRTRDNYEYERVALEDYEELSGEPA